MSEQAITAVPTDEIARQLARLKRVEYALGQQHVADPRDEPQTAWELALPASKEAHWQKYWRDPERRRLAYGALVIDSLRHALDLGAVQNVAAAAVEPIDITVAPPQASRAVIQERSSRIIAQSKREALGRIGLLEVLNEGLAIPSAPLAALHYRRADIRSSVDRALYERADDIDGATEWLTAAVPPRGVTVEVTAANADRTGLEQQQRVWSVYAVARTADEWWRELERDFCRIDDASGNS